jgi:hypothetical protein
MMSHVICPVVVTARRRADGAWAQVTRQVMGSRRPLV